MDLPVSLHLSKQSLDVTLREPRKDLLELA
jgi:hypothetical protein